MAPSPEYDKEPKAPDKSATNISSEDPKVLHNLVNDQQINSDIKPTNTTASAEVENNKHVETLDDGQLRALLDEAITYKCPKDREGKSILFKELLEEVEQDEQECEARGRRALPHSNSLQDLVAALAAEPQPRHRHHHRHHAPAPAPSNVSARAIHGGSLPSGVNTSSMVSEEPVARGAGYLATVRCVNPPPLAERRVSASDANAPHDMDLLNRRSKPMFPMTYTARATLEIGSGSVCSGRAVTTTTASNQVRKPPSTATATSRQRRDSHPSTPVAHPRPQPTSRRTSSTPPTLNTQPAPETNSVASQIKLMSALYPKAKCDDDGTGGGRGQNRANEARGLDVIEGKEVPRGPNASTEDAVAMRGETNISYTQVADTKEDHSSNSQWVDNVNKWYEGLTDYSRPNREQMNDRTFYSKNYEDNVEHDDSMIYYHRAIDEFNNITLGNDLQNSDADLPYGSISQMSKNDVIITKENKMELLYSNDINVDISLDRKALRVNTFKNGDKFESDIRLRKQYRDKIGKGLVVPGLVPINPKNVRSMSIGKPSISFEGSKPIVTGALCDNSNINEDNKFKQNKRSKGKNKYKKIKNMETPRAIEMTDIPKMKETKDIELIDVSCSRQSVGKSESFFQYCADQQKLIQVLESTNVINEVSAATALDEPDSKAIPTFNNEAILPVQCDSLEDCEVDTNVETIHTEQRFTDDVNSESVENEVVVQFNENTDDEVAGDRYVLAELPNNAYVFLTLPKRLLTPLNIKDETPSIQLHEIENNNNVKPYFPEDTVKYTKKKKEKVLVDPSNINCKKNDSFNRNALRILLFENLLKSDRANSVSDKPGVSFITDNEVDSAIPFSCITTPEVVTSCNTTSSSSQLAVAVDPKPLQLDTRYPAVGSVTGDYEGGRPSHASAPTPARADRRDRLVKTSPDHLPLQPRSVISNTFNGLPLSRPNYGSTGSSAPEDFKKSIDENGNSVQGFSSPLSGSSQHKKPRRKKSSKNETLIDCEKIDGYQGDKDVNELLRFIESNVESARGHKLGRAKHKDDSDDKSGKKRSTERRKDKESKLKRASSLEELSRTKLEDLTDAPEPPLRSDKKERRADLAAPKPERRSWGDDARDAFCYRPPDPAPVPAPTPAVVELADFQTVTKRRKPRRRPDDADPNPPPRRPRHSHAPPSDRSNDSNDDLDSVHSLPDPAPPHAAPRTAPPPPPPPPQASYADIARTRHNIPDLIESCNFYAEGEAPGEPRRAPDPPPPAPPDVDGYPALEPRAAPAAAPAAHPAPRRPRDKPAAPPRRPPGKERAAPPPEPESPAPDVVGERRPPVILLDSAARPRDMDGVTFGFDINEQLLDGAGGARRPRCDLVRDALEAPATATATAPAPGLALRYLPPDPPPHSPHLHQIVDYVGAAWEDVMRCGGGKVRYYSE